MTSRTTLGTLQDVTEKILVLQELSLAQSVDLFLKRANSVREITQVDI